MDKYFGVPAFGNFVWRAAQSVGAKDFSEERGCNDKVFSARNNDVDFGRGGCIDADFERGINAQEFRDSTRKKDEAVSIF